MPSAHTLFSDYGGSAFKEVEDEKFRRRASKLALMGGLGCGLAVERFAQQATLIKIDCLSGPLRRPAKFRPNPCAKSASKWLSRRCSRCDSLCQRRYRAPHGTRTRQFLKCDVSGGELPLRSMLVRKATNDHSDHHIRSET